MRNKTITEAITLEKLGFERVSTVAYDDYVSWKKRPVEIIFLNFKALNIKENTAK